MLKQIERQSNIELLRIIAMFMIIFHHYCLFGGFFEQYDLTTLTPNTVLTQFFALGGKIGVNIFFLITGYFMVYKTMRPQKAWKLIYQVFTINLIVCIFLVSMGEHLSKREIFAVIPLLTDVPISFIVNYLMVYLLSPIINKCLAALSRKEFEYMLIVLLSYFCLIDSFFLQHTFQYTAWGIIMYCIGAYIRMYDIPKKFNWNFGWIFIGISVLSWGAILLADYQAMIRNRPSSLLWQSVYTDANKITVFAAALSLFMWCLKINISHSKLINYIGGCFARRTFVPRQRMGDAKMALAQASCKRGIFHVQLPMGSHVAFSHRDIRCMCHS